MVTSCHQNGLHDGARALTSNPLALAITYSLAPVCRVLLLIAGNPTRGGHLRLRHFCPRSSRRPCRRRSRPRRPLAAGSLLPSAAPPPPSPFRSRCLPPLCRCPRCRAIVALAICLRPSRRPPSPPSPPALTAGAAQGRTASVPALTARPRRAAIAGAPSPPSSPRDRRPQI